MRYFDHYFDPPSGTLHGSRLALTTREIEDAGVLEVLQTPGAALGSWAILDTLLTPGADFLLREPLGRAREVKTALSGLFGRFVARAYAERYLQLPYFAHIHSDRMSFDARRRAEVRRIPGRNGDLPDWVAWSPSGQLAIVEAKGCHGKINDAVRRAYRQAERVEIVVRDRVAPFKRYAIATFWGVISEGTTRSILKVKDPENGEPSLEPHDAGALGIGVARRHFAALLRPLGHTELSEAILSLVSSPEDGEKDQTARAILQNAPVREIKTDSRRGPIDGLIGGTLTRAGPLHDGGRASRIDTETLSRLNLNPSFVGIERRTLDAVISGDLDALLAQQVEETLADPAERSLGPTTDRGGTWTLRLEKGEGELG